MPANAVGRVKFVLPLDMIEGADASWLARGDKRTSLCYNAKNWKGVRETVCKPVPYAKALDGYTIKSSVNKSGFRQFFFVRKPGTNVSSDEMMFAKNVTIGLVATSQALQKIAFRRQEISTTPSGPGSVSLANSGGTPGRSIDDEGGGFCTGEGGGGEIPVDSIPTPD
jgi:hypothetical protein